MAMRDCYVEIPGSPAMPEVSLQAVFDGSCVREVRQKGSGSECVSVFDRRGPFFLPTSLPDRFNLSNGRLTSQPVCGTEPASPQRKLPIEILNWLLLLAWVRSAGKPGEIGAGRYVVAQHPALVASKVISTRIHSAGMTNI